MRQSDESLIDIAREAAKSGAAAIHEASTRATLTIAGKSVDHDLVTDADRASEQAILACLGSYRPDDSVLAEETGLHTGSSDIRWLIDPLDGTTNFVHGRDEYAVSVAAERHGHVLAGAVHRPSDDTWTAGDAARIIDSTSTRGCSATSDHRSALIGIGVPYDLDDRANVYTKVSSLVPQVRGVRHIGSAACDLHAVITGRLDAFVGFGLAEWDIAAGRALVPTAGGECTDLVTTDNMHVFIAGASSVVAFLVAHFGDGSRY